MDELITSIFAAKTEGDTEFILSRDNFGRWFAAIGNRSEHVCIGEAIAYGEGYADFYADGATAREALGNLLVKLGPPTPCDRFGNVPNFGTGAINGPPR